MHFKRYCYKLPEKVVDCLEYYLGDDEIIHISDEDIPKFDSFDINTELITIEPVPLTFAMHFEKATQICQPSTIIPMFNWEQYEKDDYAGIAKKFRVVYGVNPDRVRTMRFRPLNDTVLVFGEITDALRMAYPSGDVKFEQVDWRDPKLYELDFTDYICAGNVPLTIANRAAYCLDDTQNGYYEILTAKLI